MATDAPLSGPDFTEGVSVDLIKDGETLLGLLLKKFMKNTVGWLSGRSWRFSK